MDTQQIVVLICRDPKIRGKIFDGDLNDPIVQSRLAVYESLAAPDVDMSQVIGLVPLMLMRASLRQQGGEIKLSEVISTGKSVIMNGINVTMRSILDRDFDRDRIDNNLRDGAANRKRYIDKYKVVYSQLRKQHPRANKAVLQAKTDEIVMADMAKEAARKDVLDTKYTITQVNPGDKQIVHVTEVPVMMEGDVKVDYDEARRILANEKPKSALDVPLSVPLPEEPVGKTGASIIVK